MYNGSGNLLDRVRARRSHFISETDHVQSAIIICPITFAGSNDPPAARQRRPRRGSRLDQTTKNLMGSLSVGVVTKRVVSPANCRLVWNSTLLYIKDRQSDKTS